MKGLIERPEWIDRILHHGKVWDIRGTPTTKVGERIALVECGGPQWLLRGHATLAACLPMDAGMAARHENLHQAPEWHKHYSTPHAWVLADVEECDPVPVIKKRGCVVWTEV